VAGPSWRDAWNGAAEVIGDRREAFLLVEEVSGYEGPELLLALDQTAPSVAAIRLYTLASRRQQGEPLQHLVGHWGFRTLDLAVSPAALIPRPETEQVVEVALTELRSIGGRRVADLGTGTGAIALSIAVEEPEAEVFACDTSPAALRLASANLAGHGRAGGNRVRLYEGDWYAAFPAELRGTFDLIVANPPYVSATEWEHLDPVVRLYDPREALVSGPTGLEAIEPIVHAAPEWLGNPGRIVVEIAPHQEEQCVELASAAGFSEVSVVADLAGRARVLVGRIGPR
jgi:release factor glutamine methyltransferase